MKKWFEPGVNELSIGETAHELIDGKWWDGWLGGRPTHTDNPAEAKNSDGSPMFKEQPRDADQLS